MKKLRNKLNSALWSAKFAAQNFVSNQRGDTNFISIAIVLVVILVIAALFITFGDDIAEEFGRITEEFFGTFSAGSRSYAG